MWCGVCLCVCTHMRYATPSIHRRSLMYSWQPCVAVMYVVVVSAVCACGGTHSDSLECSLTCVCGAV